MYSWRWDGRELKSLEFKGYEFESADASFDLLLRRFLRGENPVFEVLRFHVGVEGLSKEDATTSEATVKLRVKEETRHVVAEGNGPVSALDQALRKALEKDFPYISQISLVDFKVRILESNQGTNAITTSHARQEPRDREMPRVLSSPQQRTSCSRRGT